MLKAISGAALAAPLANGLLRAAPARAAQVTAAPGKATATASDLQALLADEIKAGMTGSYAYVVKGGQTYRLSAGVADISTGAPPRPGVHQRIGGATKSFTAVIVLQMVGERLIDLDTPIGRYLPGVVPGDLGNQITVRMLLNHTSGISDFLVTAYPDSPENGMLFTTPQNIADTATRTFRPMDLVRMGLSLPRAGAPGAMWSYASTNYVILGLLIERMTGRTYEEEMTRRVLLPAGLRDTYVAGRSRGIRAPRMHAYIPWPDGTLRDFTIYDMSWAWASSDLISTAEDMSRFYRELLGGRVLPPTLLNEMKTTVPMVAGFPDAAGYGLGIFWVNGPAGHMWGHYGLSVGQTTFSTNSEDGHSIQMTQLENLSFYEDLTEQAQAASPIDKARSQFQSAVLQGSGSAASDMAAASTAGARTPWTARLPQVLPAAMPSWAK